MASTTLKLSECIGLRTTLTCKPTNPLPGIRNNASQLSIVSKQSVRHASRITKYKNPYVGGIFKKIQLPLVEPIESEYAAEGESLYPDIPEEYPPAFGGDWGNMSPEEAWKFDARRRDFDNKRSIRERMDELTRLPYDGKEDKRLYQKPNKEKMKRWLIPYSNDNAYFFPFLQYVTKTRLTLNLPTSYSEVPGLDLIKLKSKIEVNLKLLKLKGESPELKVSAMVEVVKQELIANSASPDNPRHLTEAQMDLGTTFEAWWRRGGFEKDDMENIAPKTKEYQESWGTWMPVGEYNHEHPGILNFQSQASPFLALRSPFPLQPIPESESDPENGDLSCPTFIHDWVAHDDSDLPLFAYHPSNFSLSHEVKAPVIQAGFKLPPVYSYQHVVARKDKGIDRKTLPQSWQKISERGRLSRMMKTEETIYHPGVESDPNSFPHTAFVFPVSHADVESRGFSIDEVQMAHWNAERVLKTLFSWNMSSAYLQGFNPYCDMTYPILSHGVLTDGDTWQFCALQTDTMLLWRDDDGYQKGSRLWMSRSMKVEEDLDLILTLLANTLGRTTRTDMSESELKPFVTKSDDIAVEIKPKYEFEMKL